MLMCDFGYSLTEVVNVCMWYVLPCVVGCPVILRFDMCEFLYPNIYVFYAFSSCCLYARDILHSSNTMVLNFDAYEPVVLQSPP